MRRRGYQVQRICVVLLFSVLLGCSSGMQHIYPGTASDVPPALRELFESDGFQLQRATGRNTATQDYIGVTQHFLIHFGETDSQAALAMARHIDASYETLSAWLKYHLRTPLDIVIMPPTPPEIRYGTDSRITGHARRRHGHVSIASSDANHRNRVTQVLAYFILRQVTHEQPVPWWFMAGTSAYLANVEELDTEFRQSVAQEAHELQVSGWNGLAQVDAQGVHAPEMYVASLSVILFLIDQYGEDHLRQLLGSYSRDFRRYTFRELFESHYGPQRELEHQWRRSLSQL